MIPVEPKEEPDSFDQQVRQPGRRWLKENGIAPDAPPPDPNKLPEHWTRSLKGLWEKYDGICAYYSMYIDPVTGSKTVDHYIPKSHYAGKSYEWSNYRLCCSLANSRKGTSLDVLDPFTLDQETFFLNLLSGEIMINAALSPEVREKADKTIKILKLNDSSLNKRRLEEVNQYSDGSGLRYQSPFIDYEVRRQEAIR